MTKSRRQFITEVGGIGMGSVLIASGTLGAADSKSPAAPPASMIFETVLTEGVAELSYLIGDKATGKAAVIDPRRDIDIYVELAHKHKLTITHTLETHIHADLVSGCLELANRTGTAKVCVSAEGGPKYGFPHEELKDGDTIDLGRVILTAKHTPGHTQAHVLSRLGGQPSGAAVRHLQRGLPVRQLSGAPISWATTRQTVWPSNCTSQSTSST